MTSARPNDAGSGIFVLSNLVLITASFINGAFAGAHRVGTADAVLAVLIERGDARLRALPRRVGALLAAGRLRLERHGGGSFVVGVFSRSPASACTAGACRPRRRRRRSPKRTRLRRRRASSCAMPPPTAPSPAPRGGARVGGDTSLHHSRHRARQPAPHADRVLSPCSLRHSDGLLDRRDESEGAPRSRRPT